MRVEHAVGHVAELLDRHPHVRDADVLGTRLADSALWNPRFRLVGTGPLTTRTLVADTTAARAIISNPPFAAAVEGWLRVMEGRGATTARGISFAYRREAQIAQKLITNLEIGNRVPESELPQLVANLDRALPSNGAQHLRGWIDVGAETTGSLVDHALWGADGAGSVEVRGGNWGTAALLRHEGEHMLHETVADGDVERSAWAEASTELLTRWPGEVERTARAMGLPYLSNGASVSDDLWFSSTGAYEETTAHLRGVLRHAGARSLSDAHALLRSGPLLEIPDVLTEAVMRRRSLPEAERSAIRDRISRGVVRADAG